MESQEHIIKYYQAIQNKLEELSAQLVEVQKNNPDNIIYDHLEFMAIMHISLSTFNNWKKKGFIGYSQIGNKIYITHTDLINFLSSNYTPSLF